MAALLSGITILMSILVLGSTADAGSFYRGKGYYTTSGYYDRPIIFRAYPDYGRGRTVYVNGHGKYYDDKHYYIKHKNYRIKRHKAYKNEYGYGDRIYKRGSYYRSPRYRSYCR